jgi:hypothetical protein
MHYVIEQKENRKIMSSPFASLNKYRKLPLSKTPMIPSNDIPSDEKYNNFSCFIYCLY